MNRLQQLGIEALVLKSRHLALSSRKGMRIALQIAIPVLLGLAYVGILFLGAEP